MLLKVSLLRVDILNLTVLLLRDSAPVYEIVKVVVNSYSGRISVESTSADAI